MPYKFKKQKIEIKPIDWISRLSAATYGIFLAHFIVVYAIFELISLVSTKNSEKFFEVFEI